MSSNTQGAAYVLRGRVLGQRHPKAVLTDDQVSAMRAEYEPGKRGKGYLSLARKYGCGESTARDICTNMTRYTALIPKN